MWSVAFLVGVMPFVARGQGTPAPAGLGTAKPAASTPAPSQDAGTTTLSVSANLVNLPVLVRDKKGTLLTNLKKADFSLQVDGKPQTIRYFDLDRNLPLTLGLLVDTSQSQRGVVDQEQAASTTFLDQMLNSPGTEAGAQPRTQDRAFILQFSREVELLQDLTASRPKLQEAIKEIGTPNPNARSSDDDNTGNNSNGTNGTYGSNGRDGNARRGGTALYDAVFLAANEVMAKQKGRKAIVVLSDGVDRNSKESMNRAIEEAQRADVVVYAIYFKGQEPHQDYGNNGGRGGGFPGGGGWPGGGGGYPGSRRGGGQQPSQIPAVDGKKVLEKMAQETGGRMFEARGGEKGVVDIYNQIGEELRAQYRLGFTPEKDALADGYHRVDLEIPNQKNMRVQTRDGYYTGTD